MNLASRPPSVLSRRPLLRTQGDVVEQEISITHADNRLHVRHLIGRRMIRQAWFAMDCGLDVLERALDEAEGAAPTARLHKIGSAVLRNGSSLEIAAGPRFVAIRMWTTDGQRPRSPIYVNSEEELRALKHGIRSIRIEHEKEQSK